MRGEGRMSDNKSLCDTCVYKHSCERSDAGISWANHSVCYRYVTDKNILNYEGGKTNEVSN